MLDSHHHPLTNWGLRPILFHAFGYDVQSYSFFVLLAVIVAGLVYFYESKRLKAYSNTDNSISVAIAAIVGGTLGAKIPIWIMYWKTIVNAFPDMSFLLSGRTIVGGIVGGTLAVIFTKKKLGIKEKKGNIFAPAVAIGIAVGRIGCLLRGCCYGVETKLPTGIDFGDGIKRHPTQLYESLFMLGVFIYLQYAKKKDPKPGALYRFTLFVYFTFRFFLEFIKYEDKMFLGLTVFQIASVLIILNLFRENIYTFIKKYIFKKI